MLQLHPLDSRIEPAQLLLLKPAIFWVSDDQSRNAGMLGLAFRHPIGRQTPPGHTGGRPATAAPTRAAGSAGSGRVARHLVRPEPPALRQQAHEARLRGFRWVWLGCELWRVPPPSLPLVSYMPRGVVRYVPASRTCTCQSGHQRDIKGTSKGHRTGHVRTCTDMYGHVADM